MFVESIRFYRRYLISAPSTLCLLRHIRFQFYGVFGTMKLLLHTPLHFDILLRPNCFAGSSPTTYSGSFVGAHAGDAEGASPP